MTPLVTFDVEACPTPSYVCDLERLERNLRILDGVQTRTGAKILLALKGFALWSSFDLCRRYLRGTTASSLHELLLGAEEFGGERHIFAPAYVPEEMPAILRFADHIVFNSHTEVDRWIGSVRDAPREISAGLRINPGYSEVEVEIYNEEAARDLHGFLTGAHQYSLDDDQIKMVREISNHPAYNEYLDPYGARLAPGITKAGYREPTLYYNQDDYRLDSAEDLSLFHDLLFGGGGHFSDRERELLPFLTNASNYDAIQLRVRMDRGVSTSFSYQSSTGLRYKVEASTPEEYLSLAARLQGQKELDRYRPSPERMQFLVQPEVNELRQLFSHSLTQMESLRGLKGVELENLDHNAGRLLQAQAKLEALEAAVNAWEGRDGQALYDQTRALAGEIESLQGDMVSDRWNPYDSSRQKTAADSLKRLANRLKAATQEAAPVDWEEPAVNLEGFQPGV